MAIISYGPLVLTPRVSNSASISDFTTIASVFADLWAAAVAECTALEKQCVYLGVQYIPSSTEGEIIVALNYGTFDIDTDFYSEIPL